MRGVTGMKKTRLKFGEMYILRHCMVIFACISFGNIAKAWTDWVGCLLLGFPIIYNLWYGILFLIDLIVGPKKMRMHFRKLKHADTALRFIFPKKYIIHDPSVYENCKWVAATLVLEGKGKKTITLRAICSGPELVKYNKKGCLDVTYYKCSGIVKEIIC